MLQYRDFLLKPHNLFEQALEKDCVSFFKPHTDVLLRRRTLFFVNASDRKDEFSIFVQSSSQITLTSRTVTCIALVT